MAGLVDYAANSDSEEEPVLEKTDEDVQLHMKGDVRSIDEMKNNMKLNIRPEVTSKVRRPFCLKIYIYILIHVHLLGIIPQT